MLRSPGFRRLTLLAVVGATSCSQEQALLGAADASSTTDHEANDDATTLGDSGTALDSLPGEPMTIEVAPDSETFVDLSARGVVETTRNSTRWDLVFDGWKVYTNGGVSGPGQGAVFGPSDPLDLLFDTVPTVPLLQDKPRGNLTDWFIYTGGTVLCRMHVYGIRDGDAYWKLQVLSYYGVEEASDTELSALFQLRYAAVDEDGSQETVLVDNLDATSGGYGNVDDTSAGCLNLATGERLSLDREQRATSRDWHVCFQRTDAFVNGGLSGPGNVSAADLDLDAVIPVETEADLEAEQERFEAIGIERLTDAGLDYATDELVSSLFEDNWVDEVGPDATPLEASWIVRGANGQEYFALLFTQLEDADDESPGTVDLRVKTLSETE